MTKKIVEQDGYDFFDQETSVLLARIIVEGDFWAVETMEKAREEFLRRFPDYVFGD